MKAIKNKYYLMSENKFSFEEFLERIKNFKSPQNSQISIRKVDQNQQIIDFHYKQTLYNCNYEIEELINEELYILTLQFKYENNKQNVARAFSEFLTILKMIKQSDYYFTVISDELSVYYTNRLYEPLAQYEQNLRSLILAIFVPVYGIEWPEKLEVKLNDTNLKIKGSDKNKIEKGLYSLILGDFEEVLFNPISTVTPENYQENFLIEKVDELDKEELVSLIQNNEPYTLWGKYISDYASEALTSKDLKSIRLARNKVAHVKEFSYQNYRKAKTELEKVSSIILEAQSNILEDENETKIKELAYNVSKIMSAYLNYNNKVTEIMNNYEMQIPKRVREIGQMVSDAIEPIERLSKEIENPFKPYIDRLLQNNGLNTLDDIADDEDDADDKNNDEGNEDNNENSN